MGLEERSGLEMKQDSEKLGKFPGNGRGKLRQRTEHKWPSNLQPGADGHQGGRPGGGKTGKTGTSPPGNLSSPGLSSLEKTPGAQFYFSSRPKRAANQVGDARTNCND